MTMHQDRTLNATTMRSTNIFPILIIALLAWKIEAEPLIVRGSARSMKSTSYAVPRLNNDQRRTKLDYVDSHRLMIVRPALIFKERSVKTVKAPRSHEKRPITNMVARKTQLFPNKANMKTTIHKTWRRVIAGGSTKVPYPSAAPSILTSQRPTAHPSRKPTARPSSRPSLKPTTSLSRNPTAHPSRKPTARPSSRPSLKPTTSLSRNPTAHPSRKPTARPSSRPSLKPTTSLSRNPTAHPSRKPTARPTNGHLIVSTVTTIVPASLTLAGCPAPKNESEAKSVANVVQAALEKSSDPSTIINIVQVGEFAIHSRRLQTTGTVVNFTSTVSSICTGLGCNETGSELASIIQSNLVQMTSNGTLTNLILSEAQAAAITILQNVTINPASIIFEESIVQIIYAPSSTPSSAPSLIPVKPSKTPTKAPTAVKSSARVIGNYIHSWLLVAVSALSILYFFI